MVSADEVYHGTVSILDKIRETQFSRITAVAEKFAESIEKGGVIHIFGTGHSKAFAMEMSNRAGGLVPMHMMSIDDLLRRGDLQLNDMKDPSIERTPQIANQLLDIYEIQSEDAALIISNSGRNGALVEMARLFKQKGMFVAGVTSMSHSTQVTSRHPSGKRLFEMVDLVIDNYGPLGDAFLSDPRLDAKVCSVSSISGAFIAQCLTAEITRALLQRNQTVSVLMSANLDGADERNEALVARYKGRI
ncbi:sugar isomerase domain-containing protein [Alicyclobacillaceae bacterium I2511]|nr:sugar isomerase domain-containing protein [Alicyclobacillaceae bacterium I2511]